MAKKEAQVISIDFFMALIIVFFLLIFATLSWNRLSLSFNNNIEYLKLENKAFQISDLLISQEGKPSAWERNLSSVEVIGLADIDRTLSYGKVNAFIILRYNNVKELLNIEPYEFYFQLKDTDGNNITNIYGNSSESEQAVAVKRYVIYKNETGNQTAVMLFKLWK